MLDIIEFISKIFKKEKAEESRAYARDRLKLVLVSDRASISPHLIESLRTDLIEVISRYMTIDISSMEVGLERRNGSLALAANIPILDMKREKQAKPHVESSPKPAAPPSSLLVEEKPQKVEKPAVMVDTVERPAVAEVKKTEDLPAKVEKPAQAKSQTVETANASKEETAAKKKSKRGSRRYPGRSQAKTVKKAPGA